MTMQTSDFEDMTGETTLVSFESNPEKDSVGYPFFS